MIFLSWWNGTTFDNSRGAVLLAAPGTAFARVLFVPWATRGLR